MNTTIATTIRILPERFGNIIYGLQQEGYTHFRSPAAVVLEALELLEEIFKQKYQKITELTPIDHASLLRSVNKLDNKDVSSIATRLLEKGVEEQSYQIGNLSPSVTIEQGNFLTEELEESSKMDKIPKNFLM